MIRTVVALTPPVGVFNRTRKVSSPSSRASFAIGILSVAAVPPAATPTPPGTKPSPEEQWSALDRAIQAGLGTPYKKEGSSAQDGGVDAPGYIQWIYSMVGHPEITRDYGVISKAGTAVQGTDYKPGDILLYSIKKDGNVTFAGLYWKDGKMSYPFPKDHKVIEGEIGSSFFAERFVGAHDGRILFAKLPETGGDFYLLSS